MRTYTLISLVLCCFAVYACQGSSGRKGPASVSLASRQQLEQTVVLAHQVATSINLSTSLSTGDFGEAQVSPQIERLTKIRKKAILEYVERVRAIASLKDSEFKLLQTVCGPQMSLFHPTGSAFPPSQIYGLVDLHLKYAHLNPGAFDPQMVETDLFSFVKWARSKSP